MSLGSINKLYPSWQKKPFQRNPHNPIHAFGMPYNTYYTLDSQTRYVAVSEVINTHTVLTMLVYKVWYYLLTSTMDVHPY